MLQYQAEEGARLDTENKELQFRLAQLKENHTYVLLTSCCSCSINFTCFKYREWPGDNVKNNITT